MSATPAWPPRSAPRLFVEASLGEGVAVPVDGNSAHYLISVMRIKEGDTVLLFDGASGEWAAIAEQVRKRDLTLRCTAQTKAAAMTGAGPIIRFDGFGPAAPPANQ